MPVWLGFLMAMPFRSAASRNELILSWGPGPQTLGIWRFSGEPQLAVPEKDSREQVAPLPSAYSPL